MNPLTFLFNLDKNLISMISSIGILVYPLLFIIILFETGIVIFPFLPGDSLIFAAAALSARNLLSLPLLIFLLFFAAVLGDSLNYSIGKYFGHRLVASNKVNKKHFSRAEEFYAKYGGKTIILARFIPIIRTFAPFVAGVGKMKYSRFILFNIIGAFLWVVFFSLLGFYFGNLPFVKDNFSFIILAIVVISLIPAIIEFIKIRKA